MITKFKIFENHNTKELISLIRNIASEWTFDDNIFGDYPYTSSAFDTEIAIIHQKDFAKDIWETIKDQYPITAETTTYKDFKLLYKKLIEESKKIILKCIIENPNSYQDYIENYIKVPKWIPELKKSTDKYNL